jgi:hypothetical protein
MVFRRTSTTTNCVVLDKTKMSYRKSFLSTTHSPYNSLVDAGHNHYAVVNVVVTQKHAYTTDIPEYIGFTIDTSHSSGLFYGLSAFMFTANCVVLDKTKMSNRKSFLSTT